MTDRPDPSTAARSGPRLRLALALAVVLASPMQAPETFAEEALSHPLGPRPSHTTTPGRPALELDLPLALRLRLDGGEGWDRPARVSSAFARTSRLGPATTRSPALESRVALTRPVGRGLELGVAWTATGFLSTSTGLDLDRQVLGALIRLSR